MVFPSRRCHFLIDILIKYSLNFVSKYVSFIVGVELTLHFERWVLSRVQMKSVNFLSIDRALNTNHNNKCSLKCCQRQFDRIISLIVRPFMSQRYCRWPQSFFSIHYNGIKIQCQITKQQTSIN